MPIALRIPKQTIKWEGDPELEKPAGSVDLEEQRTVITGRISLGRSPECNIELAVPALSRNHCEFLVDGELVKLHDLKSLNGTFLNGEKIPASSEHVLKIGDVITVAGVRIEIVESSSGDPSVTAVGLDRVTTIL